MSVQQIRSNLTSSGLYLNNGKCGTLQMDCRIERPIFGPSTILQKIHFGIEFSHSFKLKHKQNLLRRLEPRCRSDAIFKCITLLRTKRSKCCRESCAHGSSNLVRTDTQITRVSTNLCWHEHPIALHKFVSITLNTQCMLIKKNPK